LYYNDAGFKTIIQVANKSQIKLDQEHNGDYSNNLSDVTRNHKDEYVIPKVQVGDNTSPILNVHYTVTIDDGSTSKVVKNEAEISNITQTPGEYKLTYAHKTEANNFVSFIVSVLEVPAPEISLVQGISQDKPITFNQLSFSKWQNPVLIDNKPAEYNHFLAYYKTRR